MGGLPAAAALIAAAALVAGCGSPAPVAGDERADVTAPNSPVIETWGVPKPLVRNFEQANTIVDGPGDQLARKLRRLRGYPVVVNQWASWCGSCRNEFPVLQAAALNHRTEVAFLGLNSRDEKANAVTFLAEYPVAYPSLFDPEVAYARSLGAGATWPTTIFVDRRGRVVFTREGAYTTVDAIERDIERYLRPGARSGRGGAGRARPR